MVSRAVGTSQVDPAYGYATRMPKSELDPEAFMQLLVAQLKYQDPMNGTDSQQFMQQTATLSSMQQQQQINEKLSQLVGQNSLGQAATLLGREVTAQLEDGQITGTVDKVGMIEGIPWLEVDGYRVTFDTIVEVH